MLRTSLKWSLIWSVDPARKAVPWSDRPPKWKTKIPWTTTEATDVESSNSRRRWQNESFSAQPFQCRTPKLWSEIQSIIGQIDAWSTRWNWKTTRGKKEWGLARDLKVRAAVFVFSKRATPLATQFLSRLCLCSTVEFPHCNGWVNSMSTNVTRPPYRPIADRVLQPIRICAAHLAGQSQIYSPRMTHQRRQTTPLSGWQSQQLICLSVVTCFFDWLQNTWFSSLSTLTALTTAQPLHIKQT